MKGVITDFFDDRGFGFLKDENYEKRFFHVSNILQKSKFLESVVDYYYTDFEPRKCYIINFSPSQNNKGLTAINISLTNHVFNEKLIGNVIDGVITDLEYKVHSTSRIVQGIKKGSGIPFFATAGGNGTFRLGYPEQYRSLLIHFNRLYDIGWGAIDVRDVSLKLNSREKITDSFVNAIKKNLLGKKIRIDNKNDEWVLADESILIV